MRSIRQAIALSVLCSVLASCAHRSGPVPDVAPLKPSPAICAPPAEEPAFPAEAGIVKPTTAAERAATGAFLQWIVQTLDWGRGMKEQMEAGRKGCN